MFGIGISHQLKSLTATLDNVCPIWDARIMRFGAINAVVIDIHSNMRGIFYVAENQWVSQSVLFDDDGDLVPGNDPAEPMGISSRETDKVALRIFATMIRSYRTTLEIPEEDPLYFMREAAERVLPYLTASGR